MREESMHSIRLLSKVPNSFSKLIAKYCTSSLPSLKEMYFASLEFVMIHSHIPRRAAALHNKCKREFKNSEALGIQFKRSLLLKNHLICIEADYKRKEIYTEKEGKLRLSKIAH
ncbi:unnamed protein product [Moneuplotes crassus]|uniref:Uncharacterized protein n=1 Tax=Euplotes crassus TaxID=5936 RepID=A0AAD1Y2V8_EUPCR|nr:unnamed protein product [Moneuplotes crassus]